MLSFCCLIIFIFLAPKRRSLVKLSKLVFLAFWQLLVKVTVDPDSNLKARSLSPLESVSIQWAGTEKETLDALFRPELPTSEQFARSSEINRAKKSERFLTLCCIDLSCMKNFEVLLYLVIGISH